jgi:type II secretory pathway component PulM
MLALRSRERRLLVLAGVFVVGVVGYLYVAEPLMQRHSATRDLVVARRNLLTRQERLVARAEAYAAELEVLRAEIARRRGRLLAGDKAPVAASELQKLIKTTAQEVGIDVRSERILASVDRGGYAEVPLEVTLSGPIRALTAFLHRLEEAPTLLALTDVKVRAPAMTAVRDLSATVALSGFIPAPPGQSPPARAPGAVPAARPGT